MTPPSSGEHAVVEEIVSVSSQGLRGEWLRPRGQPNPQRALLWLHGGAYIMGSVNAERDLLRRLTLAADCATFALDYRLAPEHPCPAAVDDAVAAYRFVRAAGYPPEQIVIGGGSAGGGLAVATLVALRDTSELLPRAAVLLSPWVDLASVALQSDGSSFMALSRRAAQAYLGSLDARDPRASPLHADLHGLPHALLHFGSPEPLAVENRELHEAWVASHSPITMVEWEGMPHVFQLFPKVFPQAEEAVEAIGRFVRDPPAPRTDDDRTRPERAR